MRHTMLMMIALIFLLHSAATAEMYQWIDENGAITFKDTPPPPSKNRKVKVYQESDFVAAPRPQPTATPASRNNRMQPAQHPPAKTPNLEKFSGTVEMYVTEWCGYCKQAEQYMTSRGIPYVKYDIDKDSAARQKHRELGGRGVPLIVVGTKKMSGFSPQRFEQILAGI